MTERRPQAGQIYRHFKNKMYQVIAVAKHSETGEELVIYQALYGDYGIYARPLPMFISEVDHVKYPNVRQKYRFEEINRGEIKAAITKHEQPVVHEEQTSPRGGQPLQRPQQPLQRPQQPLQRPQQPANQMLRQTIDRPKQPTKPILNQTVRGPQQPVNQTVDQPIRSPLHLFGAAKKTVQEEPINSKWKDQRKVARKYEEVKKEVRNIPEPEPNPEQDNVDPRLIQFLDADTYTDKYEVVLSLKGEITQKLIDDFSVILDVVIPDGYLTYRYDLLLQSLETMARYDNNRL